MVRVAPPRRSSALPRAGTTRDPVRRMSSAERTPSRERYQRVVERPAGANPWFRTVSDSRTLAPGSVTAGGPPTGVISTLVTTRSGPATGTGSLAGAHVFSLLASLTLPVSLAHARTN